MQSYLGVRPTLPILVVLMLPACGDEVTRPTGPPPVSDLAVASAGTWTSKTPSPYRTVGAVTGSITNAAGHRLLISAGGFTPGMIRVLRRVEAYDPATDTWSRLANLPVGFAGQASATLDNKFYVIGIRTLRGGSRLDNLFPRLYVYDPITNQWSRKADLPALLSQGIGFSANGLIYALWGSCDECTLDLPGGRHTARFLFSYHPGTDRWTRRADAIYRHRGGGGAMIDGKFYTVTGNVSRVNRLEVYDPATDTWTPMAKPPRAGSSAVAAVGRKLYVFGGVFEDPTRVDSYDAVSNKWTVDAPLPTIPFSRGAVRFTVGGVPRIFVPGASQTSTGGSIIAVNEMFTP